MTAFHKTKVANVVNRGNRDVEWATGGAPDWGKSKPLANSGSNTMREPLSASRHTPKKRANFSLSLYVPGWSAWIAKPMAVAERV